LTTAKGQTFFVSAIANLLFLAGMIYAPAPSFAQVHFVPNSQEFWDFSKNWTTNFGPAYRDVVLAPSNFLPCTGQYALCFESGPKPLPCRVTADGRFANCKCTVERGLNFVQIGSILNETVYQQTVKVCGVDGANCAVPDSAPVCKALRKGALIPGADIISDYNPDTQSSLVDLLDNSVGTPGFTVCPKAPYAGCMTAPCRFTQGGKAECSCPVFWGIFQLSQENAQCDLGGDLVWSASYVPSLDSAP